MLHLNRFLRLGLSCLIRILTGIGVCYALIKKSATRMTNRLRVADFVFLHRAIEQIAESPCVIKAGFFCSFDVFADKFGGIILCVFAIVFYS